MPDTLTGSRIAGSANLGSYPARPEHSEGVVARTIEEQTAKLPSDLFLWAAGGSILGSLFFHSIGRREDGLFVGQWAPTFLILGLYNELVKVAGSDSASSHR